MNCRFKSCLCPKAEKYPYPSRYATHASMVHERMTEILNDPKLVVCKDERGFYITEKNCVDNGIADPKRYCYRDDERDLKIGILSSLLRDMR